MRLFSSWRCWRSVAFASLTYTRFLSKEQIRTIPPPAARKIKRVGIRALISIVNLPDAGRLYTIDPGFQFSKIYLEYSPFTFFFTVIAIVSSKPGVDAIEKERRTSWP